MARIASFHLVRERSAVGGFARLALDRPDLRAAQGLRFWRLLGTGRGVDTALSIDPHRRALFAVWDDESDLEAFLRRIARRWTGAEESWHVRLRGLGGHGSWRGVDVLGSIDKGSGGGPIAVITRANVRWRSWPAFIGAGRPVNDELQAARGLLGALGVGETPVGRLGTFSLWRSAEDVAAFAGSARHRAVMVRTRREHWYGEELFARFEPYASSGTWDGRDPLGGA